jgi:hypothetical protein
LREVILATVAFWDFESGGETVKPAFEREEAGFEERASLRPVAESLGSIPS